MRRLCFSTLGCPNLSFEGIIALAKKYSIENIEIRGILDCVDIDKLEILKKENRKKTKRILSDNRIKISVLGCSAKFHGEHEKAFDECRFAIEAAEELCVPYIRVFGDKCKDEEMFLHIAKGLKEVCLLANGSGVKILLETHGNFNTEERLSALLSAVGDDSLGLIWDVAHTKRGGEDPFVFAERFFPLIKHVHIKDSDKEGKLCLPGDGEIDIPKIKDKLLSLGYDGLFSLEWEKRWNSELPDIEEALLRVV